MNIHAFNTGVMDVKTRYVDAKGDSRLARLASVLMDGEFRPVPIYAWAVEHPEGVIVIDTGVTARMNNPDFFPLWQRPYWMSQYRFHIQPEDEIGAQLRRVGIPAGDVRKVLITHCHFDHTQALYHFPNAEVIFARNEYNDIQRARSARFDFPGYWPSSIKPRLIDYRPQRIGPFTESYQVTQAGDLWLVPTPGHTMAHQSVILQRGELTYFFAGDTSFDLAGLLDGSMDAPAADKQTDRETRRRILAYAMETQLIYLPTHDFEVETRLHMKKPLYTRQEQTVGVRI